METCERCGADLGVGRFCLNCGHPVDEPVDHDDDFLPWLRDEEPDAYVEDDTTYDDWPEESRPSWLPWVGGAAALAVLTVVLASCLGGGDDVPEAEPMASASPRTEPTTQSSPKTKPVSVAKQASVTAPVTAPATQDLDGQMVAYEAAQMLDGLPATAWRMPGAGGIDGGTTITFALAAPTEITRVGLINGYTKQVAGVDWYPNNRRITGATWTFDDGTTVTQSFTQTPRMQTITVPAVTTSTVELTITSVTLPGTGTLGRDYTAISEVQLIGRPAA